ncbi:MAG TPA: hypothetical protein VEF06_15195, partial [Bryobacteraceae bacterium]|nr:hypothetical protein [Bryobacteraceae bacterium]
MQRAIWWTLATLLAFLALEAALFRTGFYFRYVQPNSTTGFVEDHLFWLRHTPPNPGGEVLVFGDSRVAEGFSGPLATAEGKNRITFWNFGIPGMSVRNWFYLLRDADPHRNRFRAIVFSLERYADNDSYDNPPDRVWDLNYSAGRLRLADCLDFTLSIHRPDRRQTALSGCLFKGLPLRADIHEFLENPARRIQDAKAWRNNGLLWENAYRGMPQNLVGLSADFKTGTIAFPPGSDEPLKDTIRATVTPQFAPDRGETTGYRKQWLGRMIDLYRGTPTRIVFIEMPRAPLPVPEAGVPPRFIRSIEGTPGVTVLPAQTFREFEQPELFHDGLHLNTKGQALFSAKLARAVLDILEGRAAFAAASRPEASATEDARRSPRLDPRLQRLCENCAQGLCSQAEENRDRLLFRVTKPLRESRDGAKKAVCTGFSGPRSQPNTREPEFSH